MLRSVLVLGLMSGTSADAVDAALVAWPADAAARPFELLAFHETPLPLALQQRIHRLAAGRVPGPEALAEVAALDVLLGARFADAASALTREAGLRCEDIDAVASHGQTVAHHPELRASLQLGDPSLIAERSGCKVVADFRARDLAAGGEGAPLAPFFHHAVFTSPAEARLVLNLGGIANLTWLPAGGAASEVLAFDVGPANALLDGVIQSATAGVEQFDACGARASRGRVDPALLAELLDDDYQRRPPPKSTGRERYGLALAEALLKNARVAGRSLEDLLATLVASCAESTALALRRHLPDAPARILVCGGGVRNLQLLRALTERTGLPVESTNDFDVPAAAVEAMAFSLMGRNALLGIPNHLPHTTGATAARVLGEIAPGAAR